MIEIIESGDESKAEYTLFECEECGCKWRASLGDYEIGQTFDMSAIVFDACYETKHMRCPNCGQWVDAEVVDEHGKE